MLKAAPLGEGSGQRTCSTSFSRPAESDTQADSTWRGTEVGISRQKSEKGGENNEFKKRKEAFGVLVYGIRL